MKDGRTDRFFLHFWLIGSWNGGALLPRGPDSRNYKLHTEIMRAVYFVRV